MRILSEQHPCPAGQIFQCLKLIGKPALLEIDAVIGPLEVGMEQILEPLAQIVQLSVALPCPTQTRNQHENKASVHSSSGTETVM